MRHATELAALTPEGRRELLQALTAEEILRLEFDWRFWARPEQLPPAGDWFTWLILAGRGFGKSRTGAEWVRSIVAPDGWRGLSTRGVERVALVAETAADARDVLIEGPGGILRNSRPDERPHYQPSLRKLTWRNGAVAFTYNATEPDQLRGPEHDVAWCDELAKWAYPETWDMLLFGLRGGDDPRICATTTPKPVKLVRDLVADPSCVVTRGRTLDNAANIPRKFLDQLLKRYEGTRLGRQELDAELLDDVPGALWTQAVLEATRVKPSEVPHLVAKCVAIDPAVSTNEGSDETGISVCGKGDDGHFYVLRDVTGRFKPHEWATAAVAEFKSGQCDFIVGEVNNGGDMVESTIRAVDGNVPFRAVHASRGKATRAEPVSALWEQKRAHMVGVHADLESQCVSMTTDFDRKTMGYSPDRLDAMCWAAHQLVLQDQSDGVIDYYRDWEAKSRRAPAGHTAMRLPDGWCSSIYSSEGKRLEPQADGTVMVPIADVGAMRRAGLSEIAD